MPGTDSTYILTQFGDNVKAYGKQNLLLKKDLNGNAEFTDSSLTSDNVKGFFAGYTPNRVSNATWDLLYKTNTDEYSQWQQADSNSLTFKPVASIMKLKTIIDDTVDILTTDIVMQVMLKIENALKIATKTKNQFEAEYWITPTYTRENKWVGGFVGWSDKQVLTGVSVTPSKVNSIMRDIYNNYYNDDSDLSLYDVNIGNEDLSNKHIYFASRAGSFGSTTRTISEYLGSNFEYNGRTASYYGGEIATELLQNSLVSNDTNPLSCGFFLVYDPKPDTVATLTADEYKNKGITNIRFYCSYLISAWRKIYGVKIPGVKISGVKGADDTIGLSSGVNLFDSKQITQFKEGLSSATFTILLMNICLTLNSNLDTNNTISTTETNIYDKLATRWEYDTISNFPILKCIHSDSAPYWTGQYIKDCFLRASTRDIPQRIYNIILYINTNYSIINDNQLILLTYADGAEKIVSIVQMSKTNNKITFQTKDVRLDNLFPIQNTRSDMLITGELQIENFKGETLLHVDPVTDSVNIMGKLGINQELHEIKGMVDIDNLSNRNMKDFIDKFSPLILDSIHKISEGGDIITNSYSLDTSDDIRSTSIEQQYLHLEIYESQPIRSELSRVERFALLQARVEGPMRAFVLADLTNALGELDDSIGQLYADIDTLNQKKAAAEADEKEEEEDKAFWDTVLLVVIAVVMVVVVVATAGAAAGAMGPALVAYGEAAAAVIAVLEVTEALVGDQVDFTGSMINLDDLTSDDLQLKIDVANNQITGMRKNRSDLKIQIAKFARDTEQIDKLLETIDKFDIRATNRQTYKDLLQLQAITKTFYDNTDNANVEVDDFFSKLTDVISVSLAALITKIKKKYENRNKGSFGMPVLYNKSDKTWITDYLIDQIETSKQTLNDTEKSIINSQLSVKYNSKKEGSGYLLKYNKLTDSINTIQSSLDEYNFRRTANDYLYKLLNEPRLYKPREFNRREIFLPNIYFILFSIAAPKAVLSASQSFKLIVGYDYHYAENDGAEYWMEGDGLELIQTYITNQIPPTFLTNKNKVLTYADIYGEMAKYIVDNGYKGIAKSNRNCSWIGGERNKCSWDGSHGDYYNWNNILSNKKCTTRYSMNCTTPGIANAYSFFKDVKYSVAHIPEGFNNTFEYELSLQPKIIETANTSGGSINFAYETDKTELDRQIAERAALVDDLQHFTSNNNWDAATHNDIKHLITNIYKLSKLDLFEVDGEKDTLSSEMGLVLPVTDKDDKVTSVYYMKMIYNKFENDESITMAGRSLNVDDFTRDKSYRDTLFKLIGSLTSASQLLNYGYLLFQKNYKNILDKTTKVSLSKLIKDDMVFVDRFGNGSLQLIVEDLTNSKYVQHEGYPHWVNHSFAYLYYPESNMTAQQVNKIILDEFITQYGFTPYNAKDNTLHQSSKNTFIVPYKYDEIWRLSVMKFLKQDDKCYSVSCSISVNDYISQSIIAKGDSTFYGDITVKSTDEARIFQIDTLKKTTSNMYPLGIGTQNPSTMVDIDDTSITNINQLTDDISLRMAYMNKIYRKMSDDGLPAAITDLESSSSTNGVTYMMEVGQDDDSYDTNAENMIVKYLHAKDTIYHSNTTTHTLQTLHDNPEYTGMSTIIDKYVLPEVQSILDNTLFYDRSISSFVRSGINGAKYSIIQLIVLNSSIYIIACEWNIQKYRINIIHNPNIKKLFKYTDSMVTFMNYIKQKQLADSTLYLDIGIKDLSTIVSDLRGEYPELAESVYEYDLSNTLTNSESYLNNQVREVSIDTRGSTSSSDNTTINDKLDSVREMHLSFLVQYFKNYSELKTGDMGMVNVQNSNHYYSVIFYHKSDVEIVACYINVTELFMTASVSIRGDMALSGELIMYKQLGENSAESNANKYITIDPQNGYLGINTNERFLNYSQKYLTASSAYNTKHHAVAFSSTYPNFSFERLSEIIEDADSPDYSRFGSYSSSTMVRVSKMWNFQSIMEKVGKLNENITGELTDSNVHYDDTTKTPIEYEEKNGFDWRLHKTYGPDISFEIKDSADINVELGEIKMVIDHIDTDKFGVDHIHAGFGVQVVDTTKSNLMGAGDALKNIMYVNNQKQMFIDGVWLGGKLLREVGGKLKWGKNTVNLTEE
jgi:hypothetical protein